MAADQRAEVSPEQVAADVVRSTQERCHSRLLQVDNHIVVARELGMVDEVDVEILVADIFRGLREAGYVITPREADCGNGGTCLAPVVARRGLGCQQAAKPESHRCIYHQDVPCAHGVNDA